MSRKQIEDWVQIVGVLAVVGSLIFVGLQLRQAIETRDFEGAIETEQAHVEWFALLAEHGDLWPRGCAGDDLTSEERHVFRKLYAAWIHREVWTWLRGVSINENSARIYAVNAVAMNIHSFEGIRREFDATEAFNQMAFGGSRVSQFTEELNVRLAYLARVNPNPEFDPTFCGE